jgi:outer membrane protein assembly factor BamB
VDYRQNAAPPERDRSILVVGLNGRVFGLDRATGAIRWRVQLPGVRSEVALAVDYGVVIASSHGGGLHCLDYLTGAVRWSEVTRDTGRATILIEPDQIVCIKDGYIDCFSPDGERLWQQPLKGEGIGRAALGYPGNVVQADDKGTE